jgi:SAM-dependent methyltransferase
MSAMNRDAYDQIEHYIAEIYDQTETQRDDIALIKSLTGETPAKILEPFCGNGRILIPLAEAGHHVVGFDMSERFLESLGERVDKLALQVRERTAFFKADAVAGEWPRGFDFVILGGNCFYELATAEEQEHCIRQAAASLAPGGHLYLDNNHMEGELAPAWRRTGAQEGTFPTGVCADRTRISGTTETIWFDAPRRLVRFRRTATIHKLDGTVMTKEWTQQKHPPSTPEMTGWLEKHGFVIEGLWGDRRRAEYTPESRRAIFWARKE